VGNSTEERIRQRSIEATTLNNIGFVYADLGENQKALKYYNQALLLRREVGDYRGEAATLNNIGLVYNSLGEKQRALEYYNQALPLKRAVNDQSSEATTLNNIGAVYDTLGEKQKALEYYNQALSLIRIVNDRSGEATTLNNIGLVYNALGEKQRALKYYNQALPLRRAVNDRSGEATTLNNIGFVYDTLGEKQRALEYYNQALSLRHIVNDRSGEATTLNNIGAVYDALGEKQKSLEYYNRALPIIRILNDRSGEATTLNNIGFVYDTLGEKQKALEYYNQALLLRLFVNDRLGEATTLNNIGNVYSVLNKKRKALEYYNKAFSLYRAMGDRSGEAKALNNIGRVYSELGENQKALEYLNQALPLRRAVGDPSGEAGTLNNIGNVYSSLGKNQKALEYLNQASQLIHTVGDRSGEAKTLNNIGYVLISQNKTQLAIVFLKRSVSIYETLREDIRTLPKETQQTYTKTVEDTYRGLAYLLLKADRILEAQQVLDLLKVQELNTYLKNVRGVSQPLENLPPETEILKKYNEIQNSAIALGQERTTLLQIPERSRTPQQTDRIAKLTQLQEDLNQQFNQFTDRPDIKALIESLSPKVRRQTVDTADLDALRSNLKQLNAVMIYPLILDDRLELIITTPDSPPLRRTVNVKREDLNKTIVAFRSELSPNGDSKEAKLHAQKLYNWLIKPLEADLKTSNPKTLIYAPDGQLRYIPIGALHDGNQWLTERYAINIITAKSLTNLTHLPTQQPKILAGAIGGKESDNLTVNVGSRSFSFAGLPFTNTEIDAIQTLQPNTQGFKENQFTLSKMKSKFADYNILHLATHAAIVPVKAEDSFILFGGNTTATLKEIENWTLSNFDLVVLSACETGLAGNFGDSNGEEILGLGYQFQSRGAKATIASLWRVADDSTQALMTEFYKALKSGQPKAQALQTAQRALIAKKDPKNPDFNQPYHWASFILIGNGL
jgi:CHAT domain-containing protein/Tfp pilus assembly protein PilF